MSGPIDREKAIEAVHKSILDFFDICDDDEESPMTYRDEQLLEINKAITTRIKALPSAQPETANIIVGKSRDGMTMWYQCDNCNEPVDENDLYCRGCGRRFQHGSNRQTSGD